MSQKNEQLIRLLKQSSVHMTGKQLAKELGVSARTVINYVNRINEQRQEPLILSDGNGYYLNRIVNDEPDDYDGVPQDRSQRMFYILRELLMSGEEGINAFDLADELAVSYSLMKKEISSFNSILDPYHIRIVSRNNIISAEGDEKAKRRAVTAFVQKYQGDVVLDLDTLNDCFADGISGQLDEMLQNILDEHEVYINDFGRMNLLLHLSIIVSRLMSGHSLENEGEVIADRCTGISSELLNRIEAHFGIHLNQAETEQMDALIRSHFHVASEVAVEKDEQDLREFLQQVMEQVRDMYYLDLTSSEFLVPFTLHIKNLIIRLRQNILIENPVKETFRSARPFLYDIAMYIMNAVSVHYGIDHPVSDNEFTFLVMHLALELERQKQDSSNVKCLLCFPRYIGIEQELSRKICIHFDDQIRIAGIIHSASEIDQYDYDILISFVAMDIPAARKFVRISPLMTQADYSLLNDAITEVQHDKLLQHFRTVFPYFFSADNFSVVHEQIDKYEAIHRICANLERNGSVSHAFEEQVVRREDAIPTGYINFAVPHAVSQDVHRQCVSVMIFPDGISWGEKTICCVMLMAVDPQALEDFQDMYNALLLILMESDSVGQFRKAKSFDEFREMILSCRIRR